MLFPPSRDGECRFADTVAINRGLKLTSFTDYEKAVAWLIEKQC